MPIMTGMLLTLFYLLFCGIVVYPPTEFVSAGLTISQILESYLGTESSDFVTHHVRRTCVTLVAHACLPLGYVFCLLCSGWWPDGGLVTHGLLTLSVTIPLAAVYKVVEWSRDGFYSHPLAKNLIAYANDRHDWYTVAASINDEFKRVDKISIQMNSLSKVIATNAWIIKTSPYTVQFAHQSDSSLVAVNTDTHELSLTGENGTQYVNIEVKPERAGVSSFYIRVNTADFRELQEKVTRPITILPTVSLQASVLDRFVQVFKAHVLANPQYVCHQELEMCIGCMQTMSNVKLQKRCDDSAHPEHACTECHCRPMWCVECMARWWASRQDRTALDTWLSSHCTCPLCRSTFCLLDVCIVPPLRPTDTVT